MGYTPESGFDGNSNQGSAAVLDLDSLSVFADSNSYQRQRSWQSTNQFDGQGGTATTEISYPEQATSFGARATGYPDQVFDKVFGWFTNEVPQAVKEIAPKSIEWSEQLFDSYQKALETGKPLLVEFSTEWCEHCKRLNEGPLASAEVKKYADRAIFARIDPEKDDANHNVSNMVNSLGIDRYPTTVVLKVKSDSLQEVGRIVGYYDTPKFVEQLAKLLPEQQPNDQPLVQTMAA
jgi:thiol-disulfide isomerase/thioredoxin